MSTIDAYSKPSQNSRMDLLAKIVNSWKPLTIFAKTLHRCLIGFQIRHWTTSSCILALMKERDPTQDPNFKSLTRTLFLNFLIFNCTIDKSQKSWIDNFFLKLVFHYLKNVYLISCIENVSRLATAIDCQNSLSSISDRKKWWEIFQKKNKSKGATYKRISLFLVRLQTASLWLDKKLSVLEQYTKRISRTY